MTPEVISTTKCSTCGGDAYCYVCIVPFAEELETLRTQLTTLQQENIMLAAQVERMRKTLEWVHEKPNMLVPRVVARLRRGEPHPIEEALSQTPPPTYASKVVAWASSSWKRFKECGMGEYCGCCSKPYVQKAAAAFTPEELTWLGGK